MQTDGPEIRVTCVPQSGLDLDPIPSRRTPCLGFWPNPEPGSAEVLTEPRTWVCSDWKFLPQAHVCSDQRSHSFKSCLTVLCTWCKSGILPYSILFDAHIFVKPDAETRSAFYKGFEFTSQWDLKSCKDKGNIMGCAFCNSERYSRIITVLLLFVAAG